MSEQEIKIALELLNERWYNNKNVKFAMLPFLKNREIGLLSPKNFPEYAECNIRHIRAHNTQQIDFIRDWLQIDKKGRLLNWYATLAVYKNGMDKLSANMDLRREQTKIWNETNAAMIDSYDFLIDVDGLDHETFEMTKESARNIKTFFDLNKIPYFLIFSGNGFHFKIPYHYMTYEYSLNPHTESTNIYQFYQAIAEALKEEYTEQIDTKIYDSRRLCKIPFTLAFFKDIAYVCTPINSDNAFENFTLQQALPENVVANINKLQPKLFNNTNDYWTNGLKLKYLLELKI